MANWLVIDLEATTDDGGWPVSEMEIIEIGAVVVDSSGAPLDQYQSFVRPLLRPQLTTFCSTLTRITQQDVDLASPLPAVQAGFDHWLTPHLPGLQAWMSWGNYDREQLALEWQRQHISTPLASLPHINLKKLVSRQLRSLAGRRQVGLNHALHLCGMAFAGSQHRALDDARNIARLVPRVSAELAQSGR